jgi:putative DNA methylase
MLTWGALNIVGDSEVSRMKLEHKQQELVEKVQAQIDQLGVETDGQGWRTKAFLYCLEVRCPQSDWLVPLLPSFVIGDVDGAIAELVPDTAHKRYDIVIRSGVTEQQLAAAAQGTKNPTER